MALDLRACRLTLATLAAGLLPVGAFLHADDDPPAVTAGLAASPRLGLVATHLDSQVGSLRLSGNLALAFPALRIKCPDAAPSCTVRVDFSAQFSFVTPPALAVAGLEIGDGISVRPNPFVLLGPVPATPPITTYAFTFWGAGLTPGHHVVRLRFGTSAGRGEAGYRSLAVQVLVP